MQGRLGGGRRERRTPPQQVRGPCWAAWGLQAEGWATLGFSCGPQSGSELRFTICSIPKEEVGKDSGVTIQPLHLGL